MSCLAITFTLQWKSFDLFYGYLYAYLRELDDKIDDMFVSCLYNNYEAG